MHHTLVTIYAKMISEGFDIAQIREVLARRGHQKLLPRILRLAYRMVERDQRRNIPTVTIARISDRGKHDGVIKKICHDLAIADEPVLVADGTITGGFILRQRFKRVDRSYKKAMENLYRRVIY